MRLTKKDKCGNYSPTYENGDFIRLNIEGNHGDIVYPCFNKLGQLEDIEYELGIDLITLFKALKNNYYVKYEIFNGEKTFTCIRQPVFPRLCNSEQYGIALDYGDHPFYLKDYGKTWALDKKELE